MGHFSLGPHKVAQSWAFATVLLFSVGDVTNARGYGSGSAQGEFYNDYMPRAEANLFAEYDLDKNGFLSPVEVTGMGMSAKTFKQADTDKNGKLSRAEFAEMSTELSE
tara:strand:- start:197 stop:520 length:324 start_codon:yes stop_codon:yes gene_type:complete